MKFPLACMLFFLTACGDMEGEGEGAESTARFHGGAGDIYGEAVSVASVSEDLVLKYDFGEIIAGHPVERNFVLKNDHDFDIEIVGVEKDCACVLLSPLASAIPPGQEVLVPVEIDTSELSGFVSRKLVVETNPLGKMVLQLSGRVIAGHPKGITLGAVTLGQENVASFEIKGVAVRHLDIEAVECDSRYLEVASIRLSEDSYRFDVDIAAIAQEGVFRTPIRIWTNDEVVPVKTVFVRGEVLGRIELRPRRMYLGDVNYGQRVDGLLEVRSPYGESLVVKNLESTDDESIEWSVVDRQITSSRLNVKYSPKRQSGGRMAIEEITIFLEVGGEERVVEVPILAVVRDSVSN